MIRVWSKVDFYPRHREVAIIDVKPNGEEWLAEPLSFKEIAPHLLIQRPTIGARDGIEFLQAVLNHAWEIGLRPPGFADVPLQVAALKMHLADMRALAFLGKLPALVPPSLADFETPDGLERISEIPQAEFDKIVGKS